MICTGMKKASPGVKESAEDVEHDAKDGMTYGLTSTELQTTDGLALPRFLKASSISRRAYLRVYRQEMSPSNAKLNQQLDCGKGRTLGLGKRITEKVN